MTAIEYTWMEDDRSQHLLQQALRHHHHLWSYSALGSTGSLQEGKRESVLRTITQVSFREQIPALFSEVCLTGSAHTAQRCWSHESNVLMLKIRGLTRLLLRSCGQRGTSLGPPWTRCSWRSPPLTENPGMFVALLLRNCHNSMADNVVLGQNRTLLFLPF